MDTRQLFLNPKQNPTYKAAFGVNRFENILRHLRFDDKRTRGERLKQYKLDAFNYIWSLFVQNVRPDFPLMPLMQRFTLQDNQAQYPRKFLVRM